MELRLSQAAHPEIHNVKINSIEPYDFDVPLFVK